MDIAMRVIAIFAGWIIAGGIGYWIGRSTRRTIYTPGPPAPEPEDVKPIIYRMSAEESVRLVPRYPLEPTKPANWGPAMPTYYFHDWGRFAVKLNDWDPPGRNYIVFPEERAYWLNLYGDPTKKEPQ